MTDKQVSILTVCGFVALIAALDLVRATQGTMADVSRLVDHGGQFVLVHHEETGESLFRACDDGKVLAVVAHGSMLRVGATYEPHVNSFLVGKGSLNVYSLREVPVNRT